MSNIFLTFSFKSKVMTSSWLLVNGPILKDELTNHTFVWFNGLLVRKHKKLRWL